MERSILPDHEWRLPSRLCRHERDKATAWNSAAWKASSVRYRIRVENDFVEFLIEASVVATFKDTINLISDPVPLYIHNGNADNLDLAYLGVRSAVGIV
jgi:hypothetical protein